MSGRQPARVMATTPRWLAYLLALLSCAVATALLIAGVPFLLAFVVGLAIVGAVTLAVEWWRFRTTLHGLALAAFAVIMAGLDQFLSLVPSDAPGWTFYAAIFGFFFCFYAVLFGLIRLGRRWTLARRRRMVARRGWRLDAEVEVPVPGPHGAALLADDVPADAATTTGDDVITATVDGWPVTVYRLRAKVGTHMQTREVWLVRLPSPVPYLVLSAMTDPQRPQDPPGTTDDQTFAEAARAPAVARLTAPAYLPLTVWTEGRYLCAVWDDARRRSGQPAPMVERIIDNLTLLAAALTTATARPAV